MALVLHRFPLSHYSEKVRATLDFKGLDYRIEEHSNGPGQIRVYRISGQRKLPIIEHDGTVVADSTDIALYLERAFPSGRRLLPEDPALKNEVLALEDQIDAELGAHEPLAWLHDALRDPRTPDLLGPALPIGRAGAGVAVRVLRGAEALIGPVGRRLADARRAVKGTILDLSRRLETSKYLVGDQPSIADVAAVGLTFHLKFPASRYLLAPQLAGVSAPGLADDRDLARFFAYRDQFYRDYLQ